MVQKGADESLIKREEGGSLYVSLKTLPLGHIMKGLCEHTDDDMVVIIGKFKARKKRTKRLSELVIKAHIT